MFFERNSHKNLNGDFFTMKFIISTIIKLMIGAVAWGSLLFIPAGTIFWPEAWAFLIILFCYAFFLFIFYLKDNSKTVKSRDRIKPVHIKDLIIMFILTICFLALFILLPLDLFRFHWTDHLIPQVFKYIGISIYTVSLVVYILVIRENSYLSRVVEVQKDQQVISTGPYSLVRHPMYLGNVLFFISIPLMFDSLIALLPAIVMIFMFMLRILFEEKILIKDLSGYEEYRKKVRWRLFPGIW